MKLHTNRQKAILSSRLMPPPPKQDAITNNKPY